MAVQVGIKLEEQFENETQQREAAKLGMLAYLGTELLMFGALFEVALAMRVLHPHAVTAVALHLEYWLDSTNTAILILSSFMMSVAVVLSRFGRQKAMLLFLLLTAGLGVVYLCLEGYGYHLSSANHMVPFLNQGYALAGDPASRLFVNLYYITAGLHMAHIFISVGLVLGMTWAARRERFLREHQNRIEIVGLWWHFMVLLWMAIFFVFDLLNR